MSASVAIGEFSRLTHLTVKTLRHYHGTQWTTLVDPEGNVFDIGAPHKE